MNTLLPGLYYKIYDVIFMPSYRPKEVSVESIHSYLLSSVRWCKNDDVNFIILATEDEISKSR